MAYESIKPRLHHHLPADVPLDSVNVISICEPRYFFFDGSVIVLPATMNEPRIDDSALEVGVAFTDERRLDTRGGQSRETELLEFVDPSPRSISAAHDFLGEFHRRNIEHALLGRLQDAEAVIALAA